MRTLPPLLEQTREPTALNTLVRWSFIGVPVEGKTASNLIPDSVLQVLLKAELLAERERLVAPEVMITPFDAMLLVSDSLLDTDAGSRSDLVLWPNATTICFPGSRFCTPSRLTLYFGTGCGQHALEAAAHSERVIATDISRERSNSRPSMPVEMV